METVRSLTIADGSINVDSKSPETTNVFRTRVGEKPRRIHRSELQPPKMEVAALAMKGSDPKTAILPRERCRSVTRYEGSQVIRK